MGSLSRLKVYKVNQAKQQRSEYLKSSYIILITRGVRRIRCLLFNMSFIVHATRRKPIQRYNVFEGPKVYLYSHFYHTK
jgi:hypothetical protein